MIKFFIGIIFLLTIFAHPVSAQVVINEFYSYGDTDWVEIYNTGDESIDLSSYILHDNLGPDSNNKRTFSCILSAHGFTIMPWSDRLNNGGDIIYLKNNLYI